MRVCVLSEDLRVDPDGLRFPGELGLLIEVFEVPLVGSRHEGDNRYDRECRMEMGLEDGSLETP